MKTSNKILIGSFLTALLILTSVHIALYAKYKKGDYTLLTDNMFPMDLSTHLLKDVKYVSLHNMGNVSIRTADTSKLMYDKTEKGDEDALTFTRNGDTLVVSGKDNAGGNWYRRTELSLSEGMQVSMKRSGAHVRRSNVAAPVSINFSLDDSFIEFNEREEDAATYGMVNINAVNDSRIELKKIKVNGLHINLMNSSLEEKDLFADSIRVTADKTSTVKLGGENLTKAKFFAHE
jgi:hypothetical protein